MHFQHRALGVRRAPSLFVGVGLRSWEWPLRGQRRERVEAVHGERAECWLVASTRDFHSLECGASN